MQKPRIALIVTVVTILAVAAVILVNLLRPTADDHGARIIRVGYPPVSTALPLFVAIDQGLFDSTRIAIEPVEFATANQIVEALVSGHIDGTSVSADFPFLSIAQRAPDAFKIYAWEMLDTTIHFDQILSSLGSSIVALEDLQGKSVATFPGSQLKHYLELIMSRATDGLVEVNAIEMAPGNQIPALASGSVDAIFCLEPLCTIAINQGLAQVVALSPISQYIGDGNPLPAASFAVSEQLIQEDPAAAEAFVEGMESAIGLINENQEAWRHLYPSFTAIRADLADQIPVTRFETVSSMDITLFQKEADILLDAGLLEDSIDVESLVYRRVSN